MRVACPDCTTSLEATLGEEVVCPACFSRFEVKESQPLPHRFDVHLSDGTVMPRQSLHGLREAVYTGKIPITARVRPDVGEGELVPVYSYSTFSRIYALLGIEVPTGVVTRRIAGWEGQRTLAATPSPVKAVVAPASVKRTPRWALITVLLVVLLGSVWMAIA